ncbi:MAG: hypothetical protein OXU34_01930 [Gammaproteobacteria bacterium]|nr:hypothetical protein [Gammaproteobacteria bacterium]
MEQKLQVFFMTFGGGDGKYRRAVRRVCREARAFGLFDGITGHTDESLRRDFPDFWKEHGAFIKANKRRGYGCWLWKPFLILRHLQTMREGDILLYADAGCELNPHGRQRLAEYLEMCTEHSVVTFHVAAQSEYPVKHWTKMDTILRLDPELQMMERAQHEGSVILLKKTEATINMAREWFAVCTGDNYRYLDDSESVTPNDGNFREHRHDQAILTLLLVKHGLDFCLDGAERNFEPGRRHTDGAQSPIWTSRHRTGMTSPQMQRLHIAKAGSLLNKALLCPGYLLAHFSASHLRSVARRILGRLGLRRWR